MDEDLKKRVEAAIAAGAPKDEAVKRGIALQEQRNAQKRTTPAPPATVPTTTPRMDIVKPQFTRPNLDQTIQEIMQSPVEGPNVTRPSKERSWLEKAGLSLLPIGCAIAGGMAGGAVTTPTIFGVPAGVIAGGMAGAAGGETLRQKLSGEEVTPSKITEEGVYGAAAGPVGKGIGYVAGKTLKPLASKALKVIGKVTGFHPRELMQTALPIKPSIVEQANRRGIDIYKEIMDEGIQGTRSEMADQIEKAAQNHVLKLKDGLQKATDKGIKIDAKEISKLLDPYKNRLKELAIPTNIKTPILNQITKMQTVLNKLSK